MESTNEISQAAALVMANINIRRAFSLGDPHKGREAMIQICQNLAKAGEGKELEKVASHDQFMEKVLAGLTLEQWEEARGRWFGDLSRAEFEEKRQDPAFRRELAEKITTGMIRPGTTEGGAGSTSKDFMKNLMDEMIAVVQKLEPPDLEALRAQDQKIASQLRQTFSLETAAP